MSCFASLAAATPCENGMSSRGFREMLLKVVALNYKTGAYVIVKNKSGKSVTSTSCLLGDMKQGCWIGILRNYPAYFRPSGNSCRAPLLYWSNLHGPNILHCLYRSSSSSFHLPGNESYFGPRVIQCV